MTAWVLVANRSRALLFRADKAMSPLQEVQRFTHPAGRAKSGDLITDSHPSAADSANALKQHGADQFARELGQFLRQARQTNAVDTLYIAAAPRFLGALRQALDNPTAQRLGGVVSKDLTQQLPPTIRAHLPYRL